MKRAIKASISNVDELTTEQLENYVFDMLTYETIANEMMSWLNSDRKREFLEDIIRNYDL